MPHARPPVVLVFGPGRLAVDALAVALRSGGIAVSGGFTELDALAAAVASERPAAVVLDATSAGMRRASAAIERAAAAHAEAGIVLAVEDAADRAAAAARRRPGVVLASAGGGLEELCQTVRAVVAHRAPRADVAADPIDLLSARQLQVLELLAAGEPPDRVAVRMRIAPKTVRTHARAICRRLGVRDVREAAALAARRRRP